MRCSKCDFDSPAEAKFCGGCGDKLEILCPQCNYNNPLVHTFCSECGRKLSPEQQSIKDSIAAISDDDKFEKIQRYLPKGIAEKILAQKGRIEGERKQVTVMFCDLVGFTSMSETLDPEEIYPILDKVHEILIHKVHEYEGVVNKMIGDGIMALFGAPVALEDAPQRAIRSAFAIHREITRYSESLKEQHHTMPMLQMRTGIHTGLVVVGTIGNDLRVEFTAVGNTVNLASRLESLAMPGTTYVSEDTFELAEEFFRFERQGEKEIKGFSKPVVVYRPIVPRSMRTRFDVSAERGLTPFVGRARELELLVDGFERSKTGQGQVFSIMAEAGMGKSRLLYEFRKAIANEDVTFLEGGCPSYSRGMVYHPVKDILKANFNIIEKDGDQEIRAKVESGLQILGPMVTSTMPYILELLSVKDSDIDKIPLSPEAKKGRILGALKQIVLHGSEIRPLIMVYENLHWIDRSSEEHLKDLLDYVSGSRVFLILTYRPEFVHTWGGRSYHNQLNLNRLSNRETLSMVSHLLATDKVDENIGQLAIEKTEGIPFFIEELISSLRVQGIITKKDDRYQLKRDIGDVVVPSTIQDIIMSRVDTLPEKTKNLIQTGSVAGREFSHQLIREVTKLAEEKLLSDLSILKDSELLYERGIYPQSDYVFKHGLTQEVAYNSLLQKKKTELHKRIGKTLENIHADRLGEFCEILAYHCLQGGDWQRAYRYNQEAGLKAYSHSDFEQAQSYFEDALTALKKLPSKKNRIEQEIDLRFSMRAPLVVLGRFTEAEKWIHGAEKLAREIGDDTRLSNALNYLSSFHWILGQNQKAIELGKKALKLARSVNHFSYQVAIMCHLGIYYFNVGDYSKQIEIHQEVRKQVIGDEAFKQHGLASLPGAFCPSMIVLGKAEIGIFDKIEEIGNEALEIAEQVQNALTLTFVYNFIAMAYLRLGKVEPALPLLEKCYELCRISKVQGMYSYSTGSLGYAYLLSREPERALNILEEGINKDYLQASYWPTHPMIVLADAYRAVGKFALAIDTASRALELADGREERGFEAWAIFVMATINSDTGRKVDAKQWYQRALKQASDLSMKPLVAHCHNGLGNCYLKLGNEKKAQLESKRADDIYRSLGMTYWLKS